MIGQTEFPTVCPVEDIPAYAAAAERFVAQLTTVRQIKSSGTWPIFAKPFQRFPAPLIRRALVLMLRACQEIAPAARSLNRIPIPDMIRADAEQLDVVIKSVSMLGDAALLASALPRCRIIAVFRHPCGHIASVKRGPGLYGYGPLVLATNRARELGFTQEHYEALPKIERWVYGWAFLHAKLFEEASSFANIRILRYEDLCSQPMERAQSLFAFAGLRWNDATARFIERSTSGGDNPRYYSIFRDPIIAATKWRSELSATEIAKYMAIADRVLPGKFSV